MKVKSICTYDLVQLAPMEFDDRPEAAKRLEQARLAAGFESARKAVLRFGWVYETYVQHERGERGLTRAAKKYAKAFKISEAWLLTGEGKISGPEWEDFIAMLKRLTPGEIEDVKRHARGLLALKGEHGA